MFARRVLQKNVRKREKIEGQPNEEVDTNEVKQKSKSDSDLEGDDSVSINLLKPIKQKANRKKIKVSEFEPKDEPKNDIFGTLESSPSLNLNNDNRATANFSVDTDKDSDHRSILERNARIGQEILEGSLDEGIYRGLGAHKPIINRREGSIAAGKYTGLFGPVRASSNVRMTMRIDYQPDICKDYKETGYCGFGDTCKFLHDRSDYKSGWQLEKEWEQKQAKKQEKLEKSVRGETCEGDSDGTPSDGSDEDSLPFACLICREKWTESMNPVVTLCNHYFCEKCAITHYSKSMKCSECGKPTNGIFNSSKNIIEKLKKSNET